MKPEDRWLRWEHPEPPARRARPTQGSLLGDEAFVSVRKRLPLYEPWFPTDIDPADPLERDYNCMRCDLHKGKASVCMAPRQRMSVDSDRAILIVAATPTRDEDKARQAYSGTTLQRVKALAEKHFPGTISYTYAIKCAAGKKADERQAAACLPYLWREWDDLKPERVILLGPGAVQAVTGRYVDAVYMRRGHAFVRGTPVFPVMDPVLGAHNVFRKKQFEADLAWALTTDLPVMPKGETRVLDTGPELEAYLAALDPDLPTVLDVEHAGDVWKADFDMLCCALCQDPEQPVTATKQAMLEAREAFTDFLADPRFAKVNQTIKHDRQALYRFLGVDMRGIEGDTELEGRIYEPEALVKLGSQAWLVGFGGYKEASKDTGDEDQKGGAFFASMHPNDLHAYSGRDGACTLLVHQKRRPKMKDLQHTWKTLIGPAFDALAIVERNGMLPSRDTIHAYDKWLEHKQEDALRQLHSVEGVPASFSHTSNPQKAALLYDTLKLRRPKGGGNSVAKDHLKTIEKDHPVVSLLMLLSKLDKQRSTYGLNLLNHISPLDGRIHTRFGLVRTTRLSSREPNMQNITKPDDEVEDDLGTWARSCFVAPKGYKLVALDYSQMELRVAAMLSGDEAMAAAFESGHDFHKMTAAAGYGVRPEDVTKAMRKAGKSLNFAIVFGQNEYGIAAGLGISVSEAKKLMDNLLKRYQKLARWRNEQINNAKMRGGIKASWTAGILNWHYRRDTANIVYMLGRDTDQARRIRKHWQNVALNSPIQGIANWFSLASIAAVVDYVEEVWPGVVRVVMSVHDEILLECPEELVEEVVVACRRIMLQWPSGCVKLKVDAEVGDDWGHMKDLPLAA